MSLPVVRAAGDHRSLGIAQGRAFADGIHRALDFYEGLDDARLQDAGRIAAPFLEAAGHARPDVLDEIKGLAEGAAISLEDAFLLNCIEELSESEACTTMTSGPFLLHAEQWYAGHADVGVVVGLPDDAPAFVSPVSAGTLPAVGMNSAGLAFGIDSLTGKDDRVGVPRVLVSRLGLRARTVDEGIELATIEGRAGGYAHTIASVDRGVVVETSATRAHVLEDVRAHTNHYRAPELASIAHPVSSGSRARLNRAEHLLNVAPPDDLEECARLLSDHNGGVQSICVHETGPEAEGTVFGMACDLRDGTMIVSDGPPCSGRWEEFRVPARSAQRVQRVG